MKPSDLITSKDGSVSLTKLAASTFHASLAFFVARHTVLNGFDIAVWTLYASFAVGHAAYDKTMAALKDFKTRQMEAPNAGNP